MAAESNKVVALTDLFAYWHDVMPDLRDQGEADVVNRLLGNLADRMSRAGKSIPPMVFVTDGPPDEQRDALIASGETIDPEWFALTYEKWWRSPLFRRFWESLSDEEKKQFFTLIQRS